MRRFVHDFLKWFPAAIGGGAIATAAVWTGAKDWIAFQVAWAWAQMSSPWVAFFALFSIAAYVAAIIWTGQEGSLAKESSVPSARAPNVSRTAKRPDTRQPNMSLQGLAKHLSAVLALSEGVPDEHATLWLEQQIMDKIALHDLAIWGRNGHSAIERLRWLSPGYFTLFWQDGMLFQHRHGESPKLWGAGYSDLHFDAGDVKRIWPHAG